MLAFSTPRSTKSDVLLSVARYTYKLGPLVTLKFSNRMNLLPSSVLISFATPSAWCVPSPAPTNSPDNADAGFCCCCCCSYCASTICDWVIEKVPSIKMAIKPSAISPYVLFVFWFFAFVFVDFVNMGYDIMISLYKCNYFGIMISQTSIKQLKLIYNMSYVTY